MNKRNDLLNKAKLRPLIENYLLKEKIGLVSDNVMNRIVTSWISMQT